MVMLLCMRTTMDIDDALMHLARELAIKTHRPLRAVVEEALREKFVYGAVPPPIKAVKLPVSGKNGGTFPGIDLDNSADLFDAMDAAHGSL
jgi:hypothetical protein